MRAIFSRNSDYGFWDRVGVALSLLCLLHCIATPLIILSLPILARYYLANPIFHLFLAIMIVPVGLWSFVKGFKHHRSYRPLALGVPGMALVALTPYLVHVQGFRLPEQISVVIGSCMLITAHVINQKSCKTCKYH